MHTTSMHLLNVSSCKQWVTRAWVSWWLQQPQQLAVILLSWQKQVPFVNAVALVTVAAQIVYGSCCSCESLVKGPCRSPVYKWPAHLGYQIFTLILWCWMNAAAKP